MTVLVDSFSRRIDYLRISVTDRCNLRCSYCMPEEGFELAPAEEILTFEEIARFTRIAVSLGVKKVRLTGGEPLVRRGLDKLIGALSAIPGVEDLSLTTNGLLLSGFAERHKKAGLMRVNVSLDTLDPEKYARLTKRGELPRVLEGIETALRVGLKPVKVNVVVVRGFNDGEVDSFTRLSLERELRVRFIEFMPTGGQSFWQEGHYVRTEEVRRRVESLGTLVPAPEGPRAGPGTEYHILLPGGELSPGSVGFISPLSQHFCSACNRLRLTADGKLRACLFSDSEIDLRAPLRAGASDAEIVSLLSMGTWEKPEGHGFRELGGRCGNWRRPMAAIGG
ncbi:MAG: GTP 3',8-cyclase MoaA [Nitrospinota bacterium]